MYNEHTESRMPACQDKLSTPLQSTHHVLSLVLEPSTLGWPVRRKRRFSAGLNLKTMAWLGPGPDDLMDDFKKFFAATVQVDGDVFLIASKEAIAAQEAHMAGSRGHSFAAESDKNSLKIHQVLPPGQLVRLDEYRQIYRNEYGSTGSFFADLEQNSTGGASTPSPWIPSLLTHGSIYSFHPEERLVTAEELFLSHAYNVFPFPKDVSVRRCRISNFLLQMTPSQRMRLLGNGWHLPVIASWFMYVMAHSVKINRSMTVQPERSLLRRGGSQLEVFEELEAANKKQKI